MISQVLPELQFWDDASRRFTLRFRPVFNASLRTHPVEPSQEHYGEGDDVFHVKAFLHHDILVRFLEGSCATSFIDMTDKDFFLIHSTLDDFH